MKTISVVTSLYYSEQYINEFYTRAKETIKQIGLDYEFIFVNDGSPDNSLEVVKEILKTDANVFLIDLARNFGQYPAMFAGLDKATGDLIYASDCDLEERPELIADFYEQFCLDEDLDVVLGIVNKRQGGFFRRRLGHLFFSILSLFTEYDIPRDQAWARLMRKQYVTELLKFNEAETFPAGLMHITGFKQKLYPIDKVYKGSTTYTPLKRIKAALSAITSFSSRPLIHITVLGLIIFVSSLLFILFIIIQKIFLTDFQSGWSSLIASIWCVGGLIIFCIGVIGFYIAKIFNQVKDRPLYIIKSIYNKKNID